MGGRYGADRAGEARVFTAVNVARVRPVAADRFGVAAPRQRTLPGDWDGARRSLARSMALSRFGSWLNYETRRGGSVPSLERCRAALSCAAFRHGCDPREVRKRGGRFLRRHVARVRSGRWRSDFAAVQSARARRPSLARLERCEDRDRRLAAAVSRGVSVRAAARRERCDVRTAHSAAARLARLDALRTVDRAILRRTVSNPEIRIQENHPTLTEGQLRARKVRPLAAHRPAGNGTGSGTVLPARRAGRMAGYGRRAGRPKRPTGPRERLRSVGLALLWNVPDVREPGALADALKWHAARRGIGYDARFVGALADECLYLWRRRKV